MFTIIKSLFLFTTLFSTIALLGLGCSTAPIENTNQSAENNNSSDNLVALKEKPEIFDVEAYVHSNELYSNIQYVSKPNRIEIPYYKDAFDPKEEFDKEIPRVVFNLKDGVLDEISDRTPISIELHKIGTFSTIEDWVKDYFVRTTGNDSSKLLSKSFNRDTYDDELVVFDDASTAKRLVALYDSENGDILLFIVAYQNSEKLLGLANSMLTDFRMLPDLDYDATTDISDWQTYRNDEYKLEMKYPSDFVIASATWNNQNDTFDIYIIKETALGRDSGIPGILLTIYRNPQNLMAEDWVNRVDDLDQSFQTEKRINQYIGAKNAYRVVDDNLLSETLFILRENRVYQMNIQHFSQQYILTNGNSIFQSITFF